MEELKECDNIVAGVGQKNRKSDREIEYCMKRSMKILESLCLKSHNFSESKKCQKKPTMKNKAEFIKELTERINLWNQFL
jgi:hypothetical protein